MTFKPTLTPSESTSRKLRGLSDDVLCPKCSCMIPDFHGADEAIAERGIVRDAYLCRCPERESTAVSEAQLRWGDSNVPHRAPGQTPLTFKNFERKKGVERAYLAVGEFVRKVAENHIVVISGERGTGKTHLLEAIARECLNQGGKVRYELVSEMVDRMRGTYSENATVDLHSLMEWYRGQGVLLLDDLGLEKATDWTAEKVTALVDDRYRNGGRLVVATNLSNREQMAEHIGDRLADRLWDTNTGAVKQVYLTCESYRTGG